MKPTDQSSPHSDSLRRLQRISEWSLMLSGDPATVFENVVRMIGELFSLPVVCLSEIVGETLYFKAVYRNGTVVRDAGNCPLNVSPCGTIEETKYLRIYDRVQERFPRASFLREHNAQTYLGFPSLDSQGRVVAVTCLLDTRSREFSDEDQQLLRIIGQRVAAEIERASALAARQQIEDEKAALLARNQALVESLAEIVYESRPKVKEVRWGGEYSRVLGYSAEEIGNDSASWIDRVHPDDLQAVRQELETATRQKRCFDLEYRFRRRDGTYAWMHDRGVLMLDAEGNVERAVGVFLDISERKQEQEALRASEQHFRDMVANLPGFIYRVANDPDYTPLFVSEGVTAITGYTVDDYLVTRVSNGGKEILPEDSTRVWDEVQAALQAKQPYEFEYRIRAKSGEIRWVWERGRGVFSAAGDLLYLEGFICDVTDRVKAVTALKSSQERYERLLASAPDAMLVVGRDRKIIRVNPQAVRLFGFTREELLAMTVEELMPARYRQIHVHHQAGYVADPRVRPMGQGLELFALRKDGTEFPCEISLNYDRDGDDLITLAAIRDITERKRAKAALREKTAFLESIVSASLDGILVIDPEGKKTFQNQRTIELWKIPPSIANDKDDQKQHQFAIGQTKNSEAVSARIRELYSHPSAISRDEIELKDGTILDRYSAPVLGQDGKLYGRLWTFRDVTEHRRLQEQLLHSRKMEAIGQLAGGVAHDFNNLLTVIEGYAQLMMSRGDVDPRMAESVAQIYAAAQSAANLTRQLLMFSRKQVVQMMSLNLNDIIGNLTKMLHRIIGEDVSLQCDCDGSLPMIHADAGMIEQVLMNLAVNARDAMVHGGRLLIGTATADIDEAYTVSHPEAVPKARIGKFVRLSVQDTGCGISPEIIKRIFDPFFTTKEVGKGSGLGLATVYGIVQQHRGWIEVASTVNVGTTFTVFFPVDPEAQPKPEVKPAARRTRGGGEMILVVEDEFALRQLVAVVLREFGYHVLEAASGVEALAVWEQHGAAISLVLTDLVMPEGMSGLDLARILQAQKPDLKLIYTSGYGSDVMGGNTVIDEAVNFLQKPYDINKLTDLVRRTLDG